MKLLRTTTFLFCSLVHSTFSHASELNLYMWEDTIAPEVISGWEVQTQTPLKLAHFDNDDERSLLMLNSIRLPFDVVVLDNVSAQMYARDDVLENLTELPNRGHNANIWLEACGTHAVPYFWGTVGVVYRKSQVANPPQTWADFMRPDDALNGHIGMLNDSVETLLPALNSLGLSPLTSNEASLRLAYDKLKTFNEGVLTYEYVLSYIRSHREADKLHMALAYSGDQYSLNRFYVDNDWAYVLPQGKPFIWVDCLAVSSHSKNKLLAKALLSYLMDPEIAASNANYIKAATPNKSAKAYLPNSYLNDPSLFPNQLQLDQAWMDSELSAENIGTRAKIINNILKRHEAQY
ncbi:polyamine ABC transporter substrate-binding protein [Vibrio paucivorans]